MIMYQTGSCKYDIIPKIKPVEVERKTDSSIWILGQRFSRCSHYDYFHDTWEEAHGFLSRHAESKEVYLSGKLEEIKYVRRNLADMKKPE